MMPLVKAENTMDFLNIHNLGIRIMEEDHSVSMLSGENLKSHLMPEEKDQNIIIPPGKSTLIYNLNYHKEASCHQPLSDAPLPQRAPSQMLNGDTWNRPLRT